MSSGARRTRPSLRVAWQLYNMYMEVLLGIYRVRTNGANWDDNALIALEVQKLL